MAAPRVQVTSADLNQWMLDLSRKIGAAVDELQDAGDEAPDRRAEYEAAYAVLYEGQPEDLSVAARDKVARNRTVGERRLSGRADNRLRRAEAVLRARMAQLSALQSVAASVREEAKFDRVGPQDGP